MVEVPAKLQAAPSIYLIAASAIGGRFQLMFSLCCSKWVVGCRRFVRDAVF